jgi:hypothetical protein
MDEALKMEAAGSSETLVKSTRLHGFTSQRQQSNPKHHNIVIHLVFYRNYSANDHLKRNFPPPHPATLPRNVFLAPVLPIRALQ